MEFGNGMDDFLGIISSSVLFGSGLTGSLAITDDDEMVLLRACN